MQKEKLLMAKLAELGGSMTNEDDVLFEGQKFVIPSTYRNNLAKAIKFLNEKMSADEEYTEFSRTMRYRPWDGAWCTFQAMKKAFGLVQQRVTTVQTLFGEKKIPPELITLNIGPNEQAQVPWGTFAVPFLPEVELTVGQAMDHEWGPLFSVRASGPRKYRHHVEGLFRLIEEELRTGSMYRGKAIDGKTMPDFLDLSGVDPHKVIYAADVRQQLEANVWSLPRHAAQMRAHGIPLKRAVLIEGPYGTGKTLAAFLTAREAVAHAWTFLYARPGRDDLSYVMQTARLYQPAVVFFEDMDTVSSADENEDGITQLLDLFDGITAKGTEILVLLTTNHPERIHKGMVRPGRLDAVIHIDALDTRGIEEMVKATVPDRFLSGDVDYDKVSLAMEGFVPAFVKEAIDRTMRYAIARSGGEIEGLTLQTDDFVGAAVGLRPQLELMEGARDKAERDPLSVHFESITERVIRENIDERVLSQNGKKG